MGGKREKGGDHSLFGGLGPRKEKGDHSLSWTHDYTYTKRRAENQVESLANGRLLASPSPNCTKGPDFGHKSVGCWS